MRVQFDLQDMKLFIGYWRRMQETEDKYWQQVASEEAQFASDSSGGSVEEEADDATDLAEEIEEQEEEWRRVKESYERL